MPAPRINWPQISNRIGSSIDEPILFILPSGGRELLLSIAPRLTWEATYRTDGYDFADWDDLQGVVSTTEDGLMDGVKMSELIATLGLIVQAIRDLQIQMSATVECCDQVTRTDTNDPGITIGEGAVPETYGETPTETWTDYQELICGAAIAYVTALGDSLDEISERVDNGLFIIGGIALLLGLLAAPAVGILLAVDYVLASTLFAAIVGLLDNQVLESAVFKLRDETNAALLANAIYCGPTAADAYQEFMAVLESILTESEYAIVSLFDHENAINIIYAGENADGVSLAVEPSSTCSCESGNLYGFNKIEGEINPVVLPAESTYSGINWIGGATFWECVEAGTLRYSGWPIGTTVSVDWSFSVHSSTVGAHDLSIVIQVAAGTRVQVLQAAATAGNTYSGTFELLPGDQGFTAIANSPGLKLSAWSVYAQGA